MHQHYSDVTECSTITNHDAYHALRADGIEHLIYQWRYFWLPFEDVLQTMPYSVTYIDLKDTKYKNDVRVTQDIPKSANEITWDFAN